MFKTPSAVLRRIKQARSDQTKHLDLSSRWGNTKLTQFPEELQSLHSLESLDISFNPIRSLPADHPPLIIDTLQWQHLRTQLKPEQIYGVVFRQPDMALWPDIKSQTPHLKFLGFNQ